MNLARRSDPRMACLQLAVAALATIAACSGDRPLGPTPPATGAAGTSVAGTGGSAGAGGGGIAGDGTAGSSGAAGSASGGSGGAAGSASGGSGGAAGSGVAGSGVAGVGGSAGAVAGSGGSGVSTVDTIDDFDPVAISASGLVVAGRQHGVAASWTAMTGVVPLPLGAADVSSSIAAMDRAGAVFVGAVQSASTTQAAVWSGTLRTLGFARAGDDASRAVACSGDGKTVAGTSENQSGVPNLRQQAFVWRADSGTKLVPPMTGDAGNEALAISLDGSSVIGFSYAGTGRRAFWWRDGAAPIEIPRPDGATEIVPRAVSADGEVVVGDATFDTGLHAFRWTRTFGVELSGTRDDRDQSRIVGISDDGATITGLAFTNGMWKDLPIPFHWKPPSTSLASTPPDDLPVPDVFTDAAGTIVGLGQFNATPTAFLWRSGTQLYGFVPIGPMPANAAGVALSANGSVLLGKGTGAAGQADAWLLHL